MTRKEYKITLVGGKTIYGRFSQWELKRLINTEKVYGIVKREV